MWTPSDRTVFPGARRLLAAAPLLLVLALPGASPASAEASRPRPASPAPIAPSGERAALRRTLEQRAEVLPVTGGVLLKLHTEQAGVRTIELAGDDILVNGEKVGADVLREWLKADADAVLQLRALSPSDRRALFGFKGESAGAAAAAPAPPSTPAPGASATPPGTAAGPAAAPAAAAPAAPSGESATSADSVSSDDEKSDEPEAPSPPAVPEAPSRQIHTGSQVRFGGGVTVGPDELADGVVSLGGAVHVDGQVRNDVVAVGGSVYINGHVGGDVSCVGGSVHLGPHAEIGGDVSSVGGGVQREEGAVVHGDVRGVGASSGRRWNVRHGDDDGWPFLFAPIGGFLAFAWSFMKAVLLALLVCLVILLARRPVERVDTEIRTRPWGLLSCFLAGFLAELVFVPLVAVVTIFLAISIVGCLVFLLYPFIFLAIILGVLVGYSAVAYNVGSLLERRLNRNFGSPYMTAVVGIAMIEGLSLIGHFIGMAGGFFHGIAMLFFACGWLVRYAAWTAGLGAVIYARFIERRGWRLHLTPDPLGPGGAPIPIVPVDPNAPFSPVPPVGFTQPVPPTAPTAFSPYGPTGTVAPDPVTTTYDPTLPYDPYAPPAPHPAPHAPAAAPHPSHPEAPASEPGTGHGSSSDPGGGGGSGHDSGGHDGGSGDPTF